MLRKLTIALALAAFLATPASAASNHLSVARGARAVTRQLPGYTVSHCRSDGPRAVLCAVSGEWEGSEGWSIEATALVHRSHGRIYVNVIGFEGTTSERL